MTEHANELLPFLLTIIGFLVVYTLNGIKNEIKDVKVTVGKLETDLRGSLSNLDRRQADDAARIAALEARCELCKGIH